MKVRGFTLIELIITLLIGSLLLAWGVPNYRDFKLRRMIADNANSLTYSLNLARAEAIRLGTNVELIPNNNKWHRGWTIIAEGVGGAANTTIAEEDRMDKQMRFVLKNGNNNKIVFNRIGGLVSNQPARFVLRHKDMPNDKKDVFVTMAGNIRVVNK
jgi:prepilin-type N-terminal cleavage/methylation domain-containing protein